MSEARDHFSNSEATAQYCQGPPRIVPGFGDMQRMTALLLAERAPDAAQVLVVGAGGGMELKVFAEHQPAWMFEGVDPSGPMLALAEQTLGPFAARVQLRLGYVDDASAGPFDAATCLLTLHFLPTDERQRTLLAIRRRLKPGAPFVAVHASFPQDEERPVWLARYAAFAAASGIEPDKAEAARAAIDAHLNILSPEQDEAQLRAAGFSGVRLFYAGLAFRGWVAYA